MIVTLVLSFCIGFAQPFAGIQINNLGGGLHAGYQKKLDSSARSISGNAVLFTTGMNHPVIKALNPSLYYFTIGYAYAFSKRNAFNLTVSAGPTFQKYTGYESNIHLMEASMTSIQKIGFINNLEIGKDWHKGRCFFQIGYSSRVFYGVGIKSFL